MVVVLLSSLPMQGMEEDWQRFIQNAQRYDSNDSDNQLLSLPIEMLGKIVSHHFDNQDLYPDLKLFMKLSTVCKHFNRLLTVETIANCCKNYEQHRRDWVLNDVFSDERFKYVAKRLPLLILVCAGADDYKGEMFSTCLQKNDLELVEMVFKYYPSQNKRKALGPSFYRVKTVEMAQLFVDNDCFDIYGGGFHPDGKLNLLWKMVDSAYSLELMEFCVKHTDYIKKLAPCGVGYTASNFCLLHAIALEYQSGWITNQNDIDTFLKKAKFLLSMIPDMINATGAKNETPLDVAYASLEDLKETVRKGYESKEKVLAFEQLIALFREHGALTAQQLEEQKNSATQ